MTRTALTSASVATAGAAAARHVAGLTALDPASVVAAPAATCRCAHGDNLALHRLLATAPAGSVLVCAAGGDETHGYFGELTGLDALQRGHVGLVIDGAVRDAVELAASGLPVFHRGLAPVPCVKKAAPSVGEPVELGGVTIEPGDVVVADRDGVVVVARADWPEVEARTRALDSDEDALRDALRRGERLGGLLGLDLGGEA